MTFLPFRLKLAARHEKEQKADGKVTGTVRNALNSLSTLYSVLKALTPQVLTGSLQYNHLSRAEHRRAANAPIFHILTTA